MKKFFFLITLINNLNACDVNNLYKNLVFMQKKLNSSLIKIKKKKNESTYDILNFFVAELQYLNRYYGNSIILKKTEEAGIRMHRFAEFIKENAICLMRSYDKTLSKIKSMSIIEQTNEKEIEDLYKKTINSINEANNTIEIYNYIVQHIKLKKTKIISKLNTQDLEIYFFNWDYINKDQNLRSISLNEDIDTPFFPKEFENF